LELLAGRFSVAEVSRSKSQPLRPEVSRLWARIAKTNANLRFSVRAWQALLSPHIPREKDIATFRDGLRPLEQAGLLGAVVLEFPHSFRFSVETRSQVLRIRRSLPGFPLLAEFRHISWMSEDALGFLTDYHLGFVNLDQYQHARAMPPTAFLTSPVGYVRLHGRNAPGAATSKTYRYCDQELDSWASRIRKVNRFAERTFVVFKEKSTIHAPSIAARLSGLHHGLAQKELFAVAA
jgi:uncharacterized protein YecE (DUF72 family)